MAKYFYEDVEQVSYEMHQINGSMKYGFGMLENTISTIAVDDNGLQINISNSNWKCVFDIVTPGGAFPKGKELIQNMTSIATDFDHSQWFQRLNNVQEYNNVPVGSLSCPGMTYL